MDKENSHGTPIIVQFDINKELTKVDIDLIKADHKIRVEKVRINLPKIPKAGFQIPKEKPLDVNFINFYAK